jgi:hypothetical protein
MLPARLPDEKRGLLDQILEGLRSIYGMQALVLGGSFTRGAGQSEYPTCL